MSKFAKPVLALAAGVTAMLAGTASAQVDHGDPANYGLIAGGLCTFDKGMNLIDFSIYSRSDIVIDTPVTFAGGTHVVSTDMSLIDSDVPPSICATADMQPALAMQVNGLIDRMENGMVLPGNITNVEVHSSLPASFVPGTAYIVNGDVSIGHHIVTHDVVLAVRGNINWGKGGGFSNDAAPGSYVNGLLATGSIDMSKDASIFAAMVISGGDIGIAKDSGVVAAHVQAMGQVTVKKDAFVNMGNYELLWDVRRDVATVPPSTLFD